jgi:class 3 adenylate cyclase
MLGRLLVSPMRRTLTVILASDVAGYSRLVAAREEDTIRRFTQASSVFWDLVKKHQGSVFNTAGDAILARFDSAVDAVRCAIDIQDANNAENEQIPDEQKLLFRIGVAIGDVLVSEDGDLLGDAVNVAARLESLAEAGGICISDDVRSHVLNKIQLNVIDLGDQNLHNIPRAIRAFRVVASHFDLIAAPERRLQQKMAKRPIAWIAAGALALCVVGAGIVGWQMHSQFQAAPVGSEEPFDNSKIPLITDRARDSLANYEGESDYKSLAISREGHGLAVGAVDVDVAKREALDRCNQRYQKGICRTYAVGNKVVWSKPKFPLPADMRFTTLDTPFTPEEIKLLIWASVSGDRFRTYMERPQHKALAIASRTNWLAYNHSDPGEAGRLATERCSDRAQTPCLLVSINGLPTQRIPKTYQISGTFTLAAETDMTDADKERIGKIYIGDDWRALARGILPHWYAVNKMPSEEAAVAEVMKNCREVDKICFLHAIGNFRVGDKKN